jgi:transposase
MITLSSAQRYYLYSEAVDGRKGVDSLSGVIRNVMDGDPLNGDVYIFYTRRRNVLRLLRWDRNGFVLLSKRLEAGTFGVGPSVALRGELSWEQVLMLVEGVDWEKVKLRKRYVHGQRA